MTNGEVVSAIKNVGQVAHILRVAGGLALFGPECWGSTKPDSRERSQVSF